MVVIALMRFMYGLRVFMLLCIKKDNDDDSICICFRYHVQVCIYSLSFSIAILITAYID